MNEHEIPNDNLDQLPEELESIEVPRQFHQLGIFVLDGSGSMNGQAHGGATKAEAVNDALRGVLARFKVSKNKNDFSFSVVTFDTSAKIKTPVKTAVEIDDNDNYDPTIGHGGGTNIMTGLQEAQKLATNHINNAQDGGVPHTAIILIMTDGMDGNSAGTLQKAEEIKNGLVGGQVIICTTFFGNIGSSNESAKNHLRSLSTDRGMGFKEVYDAETLRRFFISSISSASGIKMNG